MSEKPINPLRRRMIEDMTVRNFVEKTRNDYIRHVRTFTAFLGRAPDTATPEDLRLFQLHQTQIGVRAPSINGSVAALRFFFTVTLDRPEMARHLTFVREPRRIPVILSLETALVQICLCHVNVAIDLPGLPQIPAPVTDQSCAATSANTLIGVGCPHAPPSC